MQSENEIKVKIMSKNGCVTMTLNSLCQMHQFKEKLADSAGIHVDSIVISKGYLKPREIVDFSVADAKISDCNIVNGDIFYVNEKPPGEIKREDVPRNEVVNTEIFGENNGMLLKKVVPGDNSCLFTSIGFVINGKVEPACANYMRSLVASAVEQDPDEFSEAILGMPNAEYCKWIMEPDAWGGAIELSILSKYYGMEIAVVDSINAIINRFGEDHHYPLRVFLMFDGIHFDPLYLERDGESNQTIFQSDDNNILQQAIELAKEANSSRQFTDIQKFTLKCSDCGVFFSGQVAASNHAKQTGHTNFGEVMP
ncbi:ubiquitin thioesterase OTU1 [Leptopilina heterotoma]|uniref:ubiquitin thioesterase OTU1 n=1 Tax=Leptopilina heterotoma TaxID=63436 RepID=UPI001CA93708|nr:ubiquitin thioesterase OTU1 [Leptopilina heterotoma]XP_043464926.1 ubiquitin thioesterase OTU1 [Leptopilina heterotoma]